MISECMYGELYAVLAASYFQYDIVINLDSQFNKT